MDVVNMVIENRIMLKNEKARTEAKELCSRLNTVDEEYEYSDDSVSILHRGKYYLPMTFYKLRMWIAVREHKNSLDAWM